MVKILFQNSWIWNMIGICTEMEWFVVSDIPSYRKFQQLQQNMLNSSLSHNGINSLKNSQLRIQIFQNLMMSSKKYISGKVFMKFQSVVFMQTC